LEIEKKMAIVDKFYKTLESDMEFLDLYSGG
jgi:hypothetical protein